MSQRVFNFAGTAEIRWVVGSLVLICGCGGVPPNADTLCEAVRNSTRDEVQRLIDRGADPNSINSNGLFPLAIAAMHGDVELMSLLVAAGADPNLSKDQMTALLLAIGAGKSNAVQWLADNGANLNTTSDKGVTPLMFAVLYDQPVSAGLLLKCDADVNARNSAGTSILVLAITGGHKSIAKKLNVGGNIVKTMLA